MDQLLGTLGTLGDLLLVMFGFGLIIFLHELGHFVAARWAGIRVLAFAVGFGPALVSWRKGLGFRRGTSEPDYLQRLTNDPEGCAAISPTEYRLNMLPLGGYVKMLGQEDMDPGATSDAPDSYQNCTPWKRMIVISAGVVMNLVSAAALFVLVFMVGLRVEPPVIGTVTAGSPAAIAEYAGTDAEVEAGLQPGDRVVSIDGHTPRHFSDIAVAGAIGKRGEPITMAIERAGYAEPLNFSLIARESQTTGLLEFGVSPGRSLTLPEARNDEERALMVQGYDAVGLVGVQPGMRLTRVGNLTELEQPSEMLRAFAASQGFPVELEFTGDGREVLVRAQPVPEFEQALVPVQESLVPHRHLLGFAGVLRVWPGADPDNTKQGLQPGDLFVRLGELEFPSLPAGIAAIKANSGEELPVVVLRENEAGEVERVELTVNVSRDGLVGFQPDTTEGDSAQLSAAVLGLRDDGRASAAEEFAAPPGSRIVSITGLPVENLLQVREVLRELAAASGGASVEIPITLELAGPTQADGTRPQVERTLSLSPEEGATVQELAWESPFSVAAFEPLQFLDQAEGPVEAISIGLNHTRRVMLQTYLTFARLFQGTVKVEHLQGPVGIAHLGTRLADRGLIWLLFFMALISVNLAVINFLPLPIVDGGQFLMLVYEQVRGRPVPIGFQNAVTLAGLVLIGMIFLVVTFNDVTRLFGF